MQVNILRAYADLIADAVNSNMESIVAVFDAELNYLFANDAACLLLNKKKQELEGKNLLQLFPSLTASKSHRHLLQALSGQEVRNARSEGTFTQDGAIYESDYFPLKHKNKTEAVLAITKKVYYPES
jgi:PAS domain S-box-containing protein